MFPPELEKNTFRADNGEFGWTRAQIPSVIEMLSSQAMAILGGELWWVSDAGLCGSIPQRHGPPGVYTWNTERHSNEPWQQFVERGVSDALAAVERWPEADDLPSDLPGRILYHLTWVSEACYEALSTRANKSARPGGSR
jgi:hypothetical protein